MANEAVQLAADDGRITLANADIRRISPTARLVRSSIVLVMGFVLGAVSILIPILHFCTVWLLPLIGVLLARKIRAREFNITWLKGACPVCGKEFEMGGREIANSEWHVCPHCEARLKVVVTNAT